MTFYKDSGNRSVSDEEIARKWIAEHREEAAKLIGRAPLGARPFRIQGKATPDGKVQIGMTSDDDGD